MCISKTGVHVSLIVSDSDYVGIFFLKRLNLASAIEYLEASLLDEPEFEELVTGFFLSSKNHSLRVSYFTSPRNAARADKMIRHFTGSSGQLQDTKLDVRAPKPIWLSHGKQYELPFRRFLVNYTRVGLDLIHSSLVYAQQLMIWLRFVLLPRLYERNTDVAGLLDALSEGLARRSPIYSSMPLVERNQFIEDLTDPNPKRDWAHMMVNFILGPDPHQTGVLNTGGFRFWTIRRINEWLARNNLLVSLPQGWNP